MVEYFLTHQCNKHSRKSKNVVDKSCQQYSSHCIPHISGGRTRRASTPWFDTHLFVEVCAPWVCRGVWIWRTRLPLFLPGPQCRRFRFSGPRPRPAGNPRHLAGPSENCLGHETVSDNKRMKVLTFDGTMQTFEWNARRRVQGWLNRNWKKGVIHHVCNQQNFLEIFWQTLTLWQNDFMPVTVITRRQDFFHLSSGPIHTRHRTLHNRQKLWINGTYWCEWEHSVWTRNQQVGNRIVFLATWVTSPSRDEGGSNEECAKDKRLQCFTYLLKTRGRMSYPLTKRTPVKMMKKMCPPSVNAVELKGRSGINLSLHMFFFFIFLCLKVNIRGPSVSVRFWAYMYRPCTWKIYPTKAPVHRGCGSARIMHATKNGTHCCQLDCSHSIESNSLGFASKNCFRFLCKLGRHVKLPFSQFNLSFLDYIYSNRTFLVLFTEN